jgi:hypothetical protein
MEFIAMPLDRKPQMRISLRWLLSFSLIPALAACNDTTAQAQAEAQPAAATAAVAAVAPADDAVADDNLFGFDLTMDKVNRYMESMRNLADAEKTHPGAVGFLENSGNRSDEENIALMKANSDVIAALAKAGNTPREFWLTQGALMGAMLGGSMLEAKQITEFPKEYNPQWLEFYKQHKSELMAMSKATESR